MFPDILPGYDECLSVRNCERRSNAIVSNLTDTMHTNTVLIFLRGMEVFSLQTTLKLG